MARQDEDLLTAGEVASLLQITEFAVHKLAKRGDLAFRERAGRKRFRRGDVETYLERLRVQAIGRPGKP